MNREFALFTLAFEGVVVPMPPQRFESDVVQEDQAAGSAFDWIIGNLHGSMKRANSVQIRTVIRDVRQD